MNQHLRKFNYWCSRKNFRFYNIKNPVKAAELGLLVTAFVQGQDDPRMMDVDPTGISGIEDEEKAREDLEKSKFQNASGGIAGYEAGGELKKTA